jgi:RNA polymerase sigma-70 factor (ECF subfamily)
MDDTSASLLERLRRPTDADAWNRFVQLYTRVLLAWSRGLGLQDADAADLVQDVLAGLLRSLPTFQYDPGRSFRAWLRTVLLNHWRACERKRAARPALDATVNLDSLPIEAEAFWEAEYRHHVAQQALVLMKSEFQPGTWQAVWDCVVEGCSAEEAGARVGLTPGAVRAAKFRVLNRLRRELDGLLD